MQATTCVIHFPPFPTVMLPRGLRVVVPPPGPPSTLQRRTMGGPFLSDPCPVPLAHAQTSPGIIPLPAPATGRRLGRVFSGHTDLKSVGRQSPPLSLPWTPCLLLSLPCSLSLCSFAAFICCVQLLRSIAAFFCCVLLLCSLVVFICCVHSLRSFAVLARCVHLLAAFICCVLLLRSFVMLWLCIYSFVWLSASVVPV